MIKVGNKMCSRDYELTFLKFLSDCHGGIEDAFEKAFEKAFPAYTTPLRGGSSDFWNLGGFVRLDRLR
jgi:hypothetical protein